MLNICQDCNAVREYPSGKVITECPRCGSKRISYQNSPTTQAERDKALLKAIAGETIQ